MMILAIDTSGATFSAALVKEETVLAEIFFLSDRHHAEMLLPGIDRMLHDANVRLTDLTAMACTVGPGSFTGIRIGVSTVKGLAIAVGLPVIGVSTLEALAINAAGFPGWICPMIDAKRGQVYAGLYRCSGPGMLVNVISDCVIDPAGILAKIAGDALFVGSGAKVYGDLVCTRPGGRSYFAAPHLHRISAAAVGVIARRRSQAGEHVDAMRLTPLYLRRPEAEEKILVNIDRESKFT